MAGDERLIGLSPQCPNWVSFPKGIKQWFSMDRLLRKEANELVELVNVVLKTIRVT